MQLLSQDMQWMSLAIQLAEKGRYTTRPNPRVGCVLVKDQQLLAEGWHYRSGEAHAEIHALSKAGHAAKGATAYVTLEPCSHQGKTGPCSEALIAAGVARVVYGMEDPNPLVAGRGLSQLRGAGIQVDGPVQFEAARALNPGFIRRMEQGKPWVRCKLAASLDGRTAMASGESQWITGPAARADVQRLRAKSCAIITGISSILQDNSRLNLRPEELLLDNADDIIERPPLRVIVDSRLRLPLDAAVLQSVGKTVLITSDLVLEQQPEKLLSLRKLGTQVVEVHALPLNASRQIPLSPLLALLAENYQCNEVLVEAGATLSGQFVDLGLVDELIIYQAPILLGSEARPLLNLPLMSMSDKKVLSVVDQRTVGTDQRITLTFSNPD